MKIHSISRSLDTAVCHQLSMCFRHLPRHLLCFCLCFRLACKDKKKQSTCNRKLARKSGRKWPLGATALAPDSRALSKVLASDRALLASGGARLEIVDSVLDPCNVGPSTRAHMRSWEASTFVVAWARWETFSLSLNSLPTRRQYLIDSKHSGQSASLVPPFRTMLSIFILSTEQPRVKTTWESMRQTNELYPRCAENPFSTICLTVSSSQPLMSSASRCLSSTRAASVASKHFLLSIHLRKRAFLSLGSSWNRHMEMETLETV